MRRRSVPLEVRATAIVLGACLAACTPTGGPKSGTQTNWLRTCKSNADCGDLRCLCGACTSSCGDADNCEGLDGAECFAADEASAVALCAGRRATSLGLCLLPCPEEGCPGGTSCVAGVCSPVPEPTASVSVDDTQRYQTLVGIGAGLAYVVDEVVQHPRKAALFDAMFSQSGLSMLRLRNRHGQDGESVESTGEIVAAATERMGQPPTIMLNCASPPSALKANDSSWCEANPDTCTLATLPDGTFDYAGLAAYWRASLDEYAAVGVVPDYVSIQNNVNWVPPAGAENEACRYLPTEGTATVATDAGDIEVEYPGYAEALDAVLGELAGLDSVPKIIAPETTGVALVASYLAELDMGKVDAIAHHLYDSTIDSLDLDALAALGDLGEENDRPLFQSEMAADPLTTAVLMHASFAVEGVAVYVQNGFVASASANPDGLINLTTDDFTLGTRYHVVRQYSGHIAPGWVRVAADSDEDQVLASAWTSPEDDALVVVLTNPESTPMAVRIETGISSPESTAVTRTVLGAEGVERSAELGSLSSGGIVALPPESIVTVTVRR